MGLNYVPVLWNRQKKRYDLLLWGFIVIYLVLFVSTYTILDSNITTETILIRSTGTLAILLLHVILAIGPLSRIDSRFLPLLYNRRHIGVSMFFLAFVHGAFSIVQFHALGNLNPLVSLFVSNDAYGSFIHFPFEILGFLALIILFLMAATSHDFWLANLSPRVWKSLHMMVYVAYTLLIFHVMLGAVQDETSWVLTAIIGAGLFAIVALHVKAGNLEKPLDRSLSEDDPWLYVGTTHEIEDDRAKIVTIEGERVAVFKYNHQLSAVSNVCCHQNGPLGEGKIIDGLITCPWHGYQYQPEDGCAPAPFSEKIPTFELKLEGDKIFINPAAKPPGTKVAPVKIQS